jgi:hypothetical protein
MSCGSQDNATVKCDANACVFSCRAGYHKCNDVCKDSRSVDTCGDRCEKCPAPASSTPTCDGTSCGFTCDPGTYKCNNACIPKTQPCSGGCQDNLKLCGTTCVQGDCCPGDDCGPCKSCQNNRCQPTSDGVAGPGCTGTCKECHAGSCGDRPNSRVCGATCKRADECCQACGDCTSCQGGSCMPDSNNRGSCTGVCKQCNNGTCRLNNNLCTPPSGGSAVCQANGSCKSDCGTALILDVDRCVQCTATNTTKCRSTEFCSSNRCTAETQFTINVTSARYGDNCNGMAPLGVTCGRGLDMTAAMGCMEAPCPFDFPSFNGNPNDPCPHCVKDFKYTYVCRGVHNGSQTSHNGGQTGKDPGDTIVNGTSHFDLTCP